MFDFLQTLHERNVPLWWFGWSCLVAAVIFLLLAQFTHTQVLGVNAWYKPFKFSLSTTLFVWAMAWFMAYLREPGTVQVFNWLTIVLLGFEIAYIALQAGRGQLSHFNIGTPTTATLFSLMALAATVVTLATAYITVLFFTKNFPELPVGYVWAIRLGLLLFVVFSFEGFLMGARMAHTVGAPDGGGGVPVVNWSKTHGDLRIAHFVGMHALQVLPLLAFYLLKDVRLTVFAAVLYAALAVWILVMALRAKPLFRSRSAVVATEKQLPQEPRGD